MKTCKQLAALCKAGKLSGAIKVGRCWQIPEDAKKPADGRVTSGKYIKRKEI
jgi:hypothetical protein